MPKIGNIVIVNRSASFDSGAAFLLQKPSPISCIVPLGENGFLEMESGSPYVVSRANGLDNNLDAYDYGLEMVQKGLDLLSMSGRCDIATRDVIDEYLVWWCSNDRITLRITDTLNSLWDVHMTVSVNDISAEKTGPIFPAYHSAYRYFRLSQVTSDLFDAYRNMYLAFELILSSLFPKRNEREIEWLNRALSGIKQEILTSTMGITTNVVQATIEQIYTDARLPLFHAKDGKDYYSPQGEIEKRHIVSDALRKLTRIFLLLAKEQENAIRGLGASMSTGLERHMMEPLLKETAIVLSDDTSPFDPDEKGFDNIRYRRSMKSELVAENSSRFHKFSLIGKIPIAEPRILSHISRIELANHSESLLTTLLEKPIFIDGIDEIEVEFNFRKSSARAPKALFAQ